MNPSSTTSDVVPKFPEKEPSCEVNIQRSIQTRVLTSEVLFLLFIDGIAIQGSVTKSIQNAEMHIIVEFGVESKRGGFAIRSCGQKTAARCNVSRPLPWIESCSSKLH